MDLPELLLLVEQEFDVEADVAHHGQHHYQVHCEQAVLIGREVGVAAHAAAVEHGQVVDDGGGVGVVEFEPAVGEDEVPDAGAL